MTNRAGRGAGISRMFVGLMAAALLPACAGEATDAGGDEPPQVDGVLDGMTAVAVVELATGQRLEFYDAGKGALISETGPAGMPRMFEMPAKMEARQLLDVWKAVSPNKAAPTALRKLQDRLMREEALNPTPATQTPASFESRETPFDDVPKDIPEGYAAAPSGCNNGCCDYQWLSTFIECSSHADYSWFYYKSGSSYGKGDDAFHFRAMACAAVGDSTYRVHIQSGGSGQWTLPQGRYRTAGAIGGLFDDPNVGSYVNWNMTPHMHSHCGIIYF